jgi:TRAP-type C4-dicarboxylate transport system substrate-binding protein
MSHFLKVRLVVLWVLLVAAVLLVAGCGGSGEGATTTVAGGTETTAATDAPSGDATILRLALHFPESDPIVTSFKAMAERFNARTNGTYQIRVYPGGSLVGAQEMLDALRTGGTEMGSVTIPAVATFDPRFATIELPFILNNVQALAALQNDELAALYNDNIMSPQFNQKVLGLWHVGFNELLSTKPVKTLADWDGLLVGASAPMTVDASELLGGKTANLDFTETYSSLEKGLIDAAICGSTYMLIAELYDVAKYCTWASAFGCNVALDINSDVWNAMPPDMQQVLAEEAKTTMVELNKWHVDTYGPNKQALIDKGCQVFEITGAEREAWKAKVEPLVSKTIADLGDFGTQFMDLVEKANATNP